MGYDTDFFGEVAVAPPLNQAERAYLDKFAQTCRMDRERGPYFVDGTGSFGQGPDPDIRDSTRPPDGQPGFWCQWIPNEDGSALEWDRGEKFYEADQWMAYLIAHFLKPGAEASKTDEPQFAEFTFDHVLDGEIEAQGEEPVDMWLLRVRSNQVTVLQGRVVYGEEESDESAMPRVL